MLSQWCVGLVTQHASLSYCLYWELFFFQRCHRQQNRAVVSLLHRLGIEVACTRNFLALGKWLHHNVPRAWICGPNSAVFSVHTAISYAAVADQSVRQQTVVVEQSAWTVADRVSITMSACCNFGPRQGHWFSPWLFTLVLSACNRWSWELRIHLLTRTTAVRFFFN